MITDIGKTIKLINAEGYIGKHPNNSSSNYFDGDIDEVRIYDHALTAQEIFQAMQASPYVMKFSFTQKNPTGVIVGGEPPTDVHLTPELKVEGPSDPNTYATCYVGNVTSPILIMGSNLYLADPTLLANESLSTGTVSITNFYCPATGCIDPIFQCFTYQMGASGVTNIRNLGAIHLTRILQ